MNYQVKQGDILGRIGSGIGQGLADQLPKEMDRARLSQGLQKLGENKENLSPFQQAAHVVGLPGGAELSGTLLPLLQTQSIREAYLKRAEGNQTGNTPQASLGQNKSSSALSNSKEAPIENTERLKGGFATPSEIRKYKESLLQEPDKEEIRKLGAEYIKQGLTLDPNQADAFAHKELTQNIAAQQAKVKSFNDDFTKRFSTEIQKSGTDQFRDVSGKILQALKDEGEYLVGQGMSPEAASQKLSDIGYKLALTSNNLKESSGFANRFRSVDRALKQQRKVYEDYGIEEQFDDMVTANKGFTPLQTAQILDPIRNEKLNSELKNLKPPPYSKTVSGTPFKKIDNSTLDKIIDNIGPQDNLLSLAYEFRDKHKDVNQLFNRLAELQDSGKKALTKKQERQLGKPINNNFIGDLIYKYFGKGE